MRFLPEGRLIATPENKAHTANLTSLASAMERREILEGKALLCDAGQNLTVQVGPYLGHIPKAETALGVAEGLTKDIAILSRVGKPVSFTVTEIQSDTLLLSRRNAQKLALSHMLETWKPGLIIPATVTHLEPFGAFVDVGCGVVSMIGVERVSVSRIPHPACRFTVGQEVYAVVTGVDAAQGRVHLTHRELLGTWEENVNGLTAGMTLSGVVRGIQSYGAFIELRPNLSGLAEPREDLLEGDQVSVYIKAILPQRMKIKLVVIDRLPPSPEPQPLRYFQTSGRIAHWRYAPEGCDRPAAEAEFL